jgi:hypothetical protein
MAGYEWLHPSTEVGFKMANRKPFYCRILGLLSADLILMKTKGKGRGCLFKTASFFKTNLPY